GPPWLTCRQLRARAASRPRARDQRPRPARPDLIRHVQPGLERGAEGLAGGEIAMLALAGLLTSHPAGTVAEIDPASTGIVRKSRGSGSRTGWSQQQARHWRFGLGGNPTRKETLVELSTGTGTVLRRVSVPVASAANSRRTPMLSGLPVLTAATRAPRTACAAL